MPETITTHDRLGRVTEQRTEGAGALLLQQSSYDLLGNLAWTSDTAHSATLFKRDVKGRVIQTLGLDGVVATTQWTAWDEPLSERVTARVTTVGEPGELLSETKYHYSKQGTLLRTNQRFAPLGVVSTAMTREGGSRVVTATGLTSSLDGEPDGPFVRGEERRYDLAGREVSMQSGRLDTTSGKVRETDVFARSAVAEYAGALPLRTVVSEPRAGESYEINRSYDSLGRVTREQRAGEQPTVITYDEAGNAKAVKQPGYDESTATYDSRGLALVQNKPDGSAVRFKYDSLGNATSYVDEAGRETIYSYDGIGRIARVDYPDATYERTLYAAKSGVVTATRDRAGQWLAYHYAVDGRLHELRDGGRAAEPSFDGTALVRYTYDSGGRPTLVANAAAGTAFSDYDLAGRPHVIESIRYKEASGLSSSAVELDRHRISYHWNEFGEIDAFRMPVARPQHLVPATGAWLGGISQTYDSGGNLASQRMSDGTLETLSESISRSPGRPVLRTLPRSSGAIVSRRAYAGRGTAIEGVPDSSIAVAPNNGMLAQLVVTSGDRQIVETNALRDSALRVSFAGASSAGSRSSIWNYDSLGRLLTETRLALPDATGSVPMNANGYLPADFRHARVMTPRLGTTQLAELAQRGIASPVPSTWTAEEGPAHAVETLTERERTSDYVVTGARRTSDGVWSFEYDALGRMTAQERATGEARRIEYDYDPNDRVVGRTAMQKTDDRWTLETRTSVLARDGLPASTTFVWDPMTDRLVSIFEADRSLNATDANDGLLRQYLHGDENYDDPIEVRLRGATGIRRYAPVIDPLSGGSITAVLDEEGKLAERVLYADAYGDAPRYLHGPIVERIALEAEKDGSGAIRQIIVRVGISEILDAASIADGIALDAVTSDGSTVAATTSVVPQLENPQTITWTLDAAQWQALTEAGGAATLRIRIKPSLRAEAWSDSSVMPPPLWAQIVFGVKPLVGAPFVAVRSLDEIRGAITSGPSTTLTIYEISDIYLAASDESKTKLMTGFKAYPFIEPANGMVYARARW